MGWYFSLKEKYNYESQDNLKPVLFEKFLCSVVDVVCLFVCILFIFLIYYMQFFNQCRLANVIKVVNLYECISTMSMVS